jgi:large subunit ribosomal protein L10
MTSSPGCEGGFLLATTLKKQEKIDKKAEKVETVADLTSRLKASSTAVLADYRGMTVGQMRELRSKLRDGGIEMVVVKNTLARRAARAAGYEPLSTELVGPIAMLFAADDVSAPARILNDYIRANRKMVIKGGLLEGQVVKADVVVELADLPSREVLLGRLLGAMQAPLGNLASVLQAPLSKFARTLDAVRTQKESQSPAPTAAAS